MIILKVIVTIAVVTALSVVAERVSLRAAGLLSGLPLGSAITLFFIGVEQGPNFAGQSALFNVAGLTSTLFLLLIYYLVSSRVRRGGIWAASLCGAAVHIGLDGLLHALDLPAWAGIAITAITLPAFIAGFRLIPNATITERVQLGPRVLIFRAALSAAIILLVTGVAGLVGPNLAGLFSAFPTTFFPLLLIVHSTYGAEQAHTVLKNLPTGLWSLVLYSLVVSFAYPGMGVILGTLVGLVVAMLYQAGLYTLTRQRTKLQVAG